MIESHLYIIYYKNLYKKENILEIQNYINNFIKDCKMLRVEPSGIYKRASIFLNKYGRKS